MTEIYRFIEKSKKIFEILDIKKIHDFDFCHRLLISLMTSEQCVKYAKYSAELVLNLFEKRVYKGPENTINKIKKRLTCSCEKTKKDATNAANAVYAAADDYASNAEYAYHTTKTEILDYGIKLLREGEK